MLANRVIPCLLVQDGGLVKSIRFRSPAYVGDPLNAVKIFNEKEVDELVVLDIEASRENRDPDFDYVGELARHCFMPIAYGGGVRSLETAKRLFQLGIEKVVINAQLHDSMAVVSQIAAEYGNQSVICSVDVAKSRFGRYFLYDYRKKGKAKGSPDWKVFLRDCIEARCGEILLQAVNEDGSMSGPDLELVRMAAEICKVPLIAMGGIGSVDHMAQCINAGANAVAAGSFFVFKQPHRAVLISYPAYGELESRLGNTTADQV